MRDNIVNFNEAANVNIRRSAFKIPSRELTTFNAGELVPIFVDEVLPGDTWDMKTSFLCRSQTPIHPTMDNSYLDIFYFFVPSRLVWDNWQHFNGESDTAWAQDTEYTVPQLYLKTGSSIAVNSIMDHFGVFFNGTATDDDNISVNALPIRCYEKIWNDWFRDENLQDAIDIYTGDNARAMASVTYDYIAANSLLKVAKYHDYFTSALPKPQKGDDVLIPTSGLGLVQNVPAFNSYNTGSSGSTHSYFAQPLSYQEVNSQGVFVAKEYNMDHPQELGDGTFNKMVGGLPQVTADWGDVSSNPTYAGGLGIGNSHNVDWFPNGTLAANLSTIQITVNNLRLAVQAQKLLEKDARGGTRYTEILRSHFGVISPDGRLQRAEYLGGKHCRLNMNEVAQTNDPGEDGAGALGNLAGYSCSADTNHDFKRSFVEHGYIIGLACVRTEHTYSQGIAKLWSKKTRFDFYWPVLANIGEQPILTKEIYLQDDKTKNEQVFGYQEAWSEYRYRSNHLSGFFRPGISNSLAAWHYGDYFISQPILSNSFIKETNVNVARTLAYQDTSTTPQFIADFAFAPVCYRPLPVYSIPGFMDHF